MPESKPRSRRRKPDDATRREAASMDDVTFSDFDDDAIDFDDGGDFDDESADETPKKRATRKKAAAKSTRKKSTKATKTTRKKATRAKSSSEDDAADDASDSDEAKPVRKTARKTTRRTASRKAADEGEPGETVEFSAEELEAELARRRSELSGTSSDEIDFDDDERDDDAPASRSSSRGRKTASRSKPSSRSRSVRSRKADNDADREADEFDFDDDETQALEIPREQSRSGTSGRKGRSERASTYGDGDGADTGADSDTRGSRASKDRKDTRDTRDSQDTRDQESETMLEDDNGAIGFDEEDEDRPRRSRRRRRGEQSRDDRDTQNDTQNDTRGGSRSESRNEGDRNGESQSDRGRSRSRGSRGDNRSDNRGDARSDARSDSRDDGDGSGKGRRRRRRGRRGKSGEADTRNQSGGGGNNANSKRGRRSRGGKKQQNYSQPAVTGDYSDASGPCDGVFEMHPKGYGFLRSKDNDFAAQEADPFISTQFIEKYCLREGAFLTGELGPGHRNQGPRVKEIETIEGMPAEDYCGVADFDKLTPVNPFEQIRLETGPSPITMRVVDLLAPIGKGQRALIVAPPRSGKTILLQQIADSVAHNHPECHLMVLLIDERPEEVTEMRRHVKGEVIASTLDNNLENHVRVSQLVVERAKRLAERGEDVFLLLDSITRTARAFNKYSNNGPTGSGGMGVRAMEIPKKLFGTARRFDEGGSVTVVGTALTETGGRIDDVIFQEFKGTGNMELVLSRDLADRRIFPAIDISKTGTRREELLLNPEVLEGVNMMRRSLLSLHPVEAMEQLIRTLAKFNTNAEFLAKIRSVM